MSYHLFQNSDEFRAGPSYQDSHDGIPLSAVTETQVQKWQEKSGLAPVTFQKILNKLIKLNVKLCPDELVTTLIGPKRPEDIEHLFYIGDLKLLDMPSVSVVGTREPSQEGKRRAVKVSSQLVKLGYAVMSGLAKGIDRMAHEAALDAGGKTIAVLGVPFHKLYPEENIPLFHRIVDEGGLCLTPALPYQEHGRWLFPRRNKLMALLSKATIVVEAGPTSGVKHQAAECLRKNRKLIFLQSLADKPEIQWIQAFLRSGGVTVSDFPSLESALE